MISNLSVKPRNGREKRCYNQGHESGYREGYHEGLAQGRSDAEKAFAAKSKDDREQRRQHANIQLLEKAAYFQECITKLAMSANGNL